MTRLVSSLSIQRPFSHRSLALGLALILLSVAAATAEAEPDRTVNLELLLAVDASSSISGEEFDRCLR